MGQGGGPGGGPSRVWVVPCPWGLAELSGSTGTWHRGQDLGSAAGMLGLSRDTCERACDTVWVCAPVSVGQCGGGSPPPTRAPGCPGLCSPPASEPLPVLFHAGTPFPLGPTCLPLLPQVAAATSQRPWWPTPHQPVSPVRCWQACTRQTFTAGAVKMAVPTASAPRHPGSPYLDPGTP